MGSACSTPSTEVLPRNGSAPAKRPPRRHRHSTSPYGSVDALPPPNHASHTKDAPKEHNRAAASETFRARRPPLPPPRPSADEEKALERCVSALREGEKRLYGSQSSAATTEGDPAVHPFATGGHRHRDFFSCSANSKAGGGGTRSLLLSPTVLSLSGLQESISDWSVSTEDYVLDGEQFCAPGHRGDCHSPSSPVPHIPPQSSI